MSVFTVQTVFSLLDAFALLCVCFAVLCSGCEQLARPLIYMSSAARTLKATSNKPAAGGPWLRRADFAKRHCGATRERINN